MEDLKEALQDIVHRRENGQPVTDSRLAALEVVHKRLEKRENEALAWLAAAGATISDFEDIASDVVREGRATTSRSDKGNSSAVSGSIRPFI